MSGKFGICIVLAVFLCFCIAGCDMLDDVLTPGRNTQASNSAEAEEADETGSDELSSDDELDYGSGWWGCFAADGNFFTIYDVSKSSFYFDYENIYTKESIQNAVAELKNTGAAADSMRFELEGDILTVYRPGQPNDGDEDPEVSIDYWRAFDYTEINPALLNEDEDMVRQDDALEALKEALSGYLREGVSIKQAGAAEINGQQCWVFMTVSNSGTGGSASYAVTREGALFLRNDYLLTYVVQPYTLLDFTPKLETAPN